MSSELSTNITAFSSEENELLAYLLDQEGIADYQQPETIPHYEHSSEVLLSYEQQRLWYLEQLHPGSAVYHIAPSIHLQGPLQVDALHRGIQTILQRHDSLRTTFEDRDGIPYQLVHATCQLPFPVTDLRAFPATEKQQRADEMALHDAQEPFDLNCLPLVRAQLVRLEDEEWILLLTFHHIIFDGWSFDLFFPELAECYRAYSNQKEPSLKPLAIQYTDYAIWQREEYQQGIYASQRTYWEKQLQDVSAVLDLPRDYPRPRLSQFVGDRLPIQINAAQTELLRKLAQQEGCSLYMVILAAWFALLYRYSGQEDLVVGTPVANRTNPDEEPLLGLFVNTLALRVFMGDDPDFLELLRRVRKVALQAYEYQELPFDQVVNLVQPSRELTHLPLVQVFFSFQTKTKELLPLPGIKATLQHRRTMTAKFDVQLDLVEEAGKLSGYLEYSSELFTPERIQRMRGHLDTLFHTITSDPQQALNRLPLLTDAEQQQMLRGWNQTRTAYPQTQYLPQLIEEQVKRTPEAVALIFEGQRLTYRELNRRANQLAHYLQEAGVGPDVLVGVCLYRSVEMLVALLAILKAGGAYVPLDPDHPSERLAFMIADADMSFVLSQQEVGPRLPASQASILIMDAETVAWDQASTENLNGCVEADHLAYMIYTSGSTGKPKGVMNTHRGIRNRLCWMRETHPLTQADRVLQKTPFTFDVSAWEFFWPLLTGACLVIARPDGHRDPAYLIQVIAEQQITNMHFVPSMLQAFLEAPNMDACQSLHRVICSGEALPLDLQKRFFAQLQHCKLYNLYGPTEAAIEVTAWTCTAENDLETVPIGSPIANTTTYILNKALQPVPIGVPGELYLGGDGLARGYLKQPALTAKAFIPHPFSTTGGERLYKTGDLACYLPDGNIDFLGRLDYQIKLRGFRIEAGEIETLLDSHPTVRQSVVVAREDSRGQKRLLAYFVPAQEQGSSIEDLRAHLLLHVPAYMVPATFVSLPELPLTSSGKVNRKALPAPEQATGSETEEASQRAGLSAAYVPPDNEVEHTMVAIWEEFLGVSPIGIHDRFDELGGDSLLILRVISRLYNTFLVRLTIRDFLTDLTIARLASIISQRLAQASDRITLEQEEIAGHRQPETIPHQAHSGEVVLSYEQQRLWYLEQLHPGSAVYHITPSIHLQGPLQIEALQRSFQTILQRHEILRTSFEAREGIPYQLVHAACQFPFPVTDLRAFPTGEKQHRAEELASQDAQEPFDLSRLPLIRAQLLRLDDQEWTLLLTFHHLIFDGWSFDLFFQELSECYRADLQQEEPQLKPLVIQYADYTLWQRGIHQQEVYASQRAYWEKQLQDVPAILDLPRDYPRPRLSQFVGDRLPVQIGAAQTELLRKLARHEGCSLYMVVLAVWFALLYRYSGQAELVVGTPMANRTNQAEEPLIGFFVNTLALRVLTGDDPSFRELLRRVREVTLQAHENQELPFDQVVGLVQPSRELTHLPLVQVVFSFQTRTKEPLQLPGIEVTLTNRRTMTAKFDVQLDLIEGAEGLSGILEYSSELFTPERIQRMRGHLDTLFHAITSDPQQALNRLPLLTDAEQQVHRDWNQTRTTYPQTRCLPQLIEEQVERTPDKVALIFEGQRLTYRELNRRANQLAHYLQEAGVGPDVLVAICVERSLNMLIGLLGILKAGGGYIPLDPDYPQERLAFMLENAAVPLLITQQSLLDQLPPHKARIICLDTDAEKIGSAAITNPVTDLTSQHLCYVIYTSGSTGRPKGVQLSHQAVVNFLFSMQQNPGLTAHDTLLAVTTLSFDIAGLELYLPLVTGAQVVIVSRDTATNGTALAALLENAQATIMQATPVTWNILLASGWQGKTDLKALCGGEALPAELVRDLLPRVGSLYNMYGPTETTIWSTLSQIKSADSPISVGRPIANTSLAILDKYYQPVPVGIPGELYLGGDGLARGYLKQPALTAETFIPHPFSTTGGERLYKTGDLACYLPDGSVDLLGRLDYQIKLRGFRIEVGEIETLLDSHPTVRQSVVVAREDSRGQKRLLAYFVPAQEHGSSIEDLRAYLQLHVPAYMVPAMFVSLSELPLTSSGKVNRKALPAPEQATGSETEEASQRAGLSAAYLPPDNEVERTMVAIWEEFLGVSPIGIHDRFDELGGDSLLILQVISRLYNTFLVRLTISDFLMGPTIARLAALISQRLVQEFDRDILEQLLEELGS